MSDTNHSIHNEPIDLSVGSADISMMDAYRNTLRVYADAHFAEMYFEKWKAELPVVQLEAFSRRVGTAGKILDAGCGPGHHTAYLYALGHKAVGVDLSQEALKLAASNFNGPSFVRADMLHTPFADSTFSGVWSCASVIHFPAPLLQHQLLEFHRILDCQGILALTLTVGQSEHFDLYGRFFQTSPKLSDLTDRLSLIGFEVDGWESRLLSKTTEGGEQSAAWGTLTARKSQ